MLRPIPSVLALLAAMLITAPAIAADIDNNWSGDGSDSGGLRDGYPTEPGDWAGLGDKDDPITMQTGVRYWYSIGSQNFTDAAGGFSSGDTSQTGETYLRIEDHSTNTYAKVLAGYAFNITGNYANPYSTGGVSDGHVGYIGADIGWNMWGDNHGSGLGALVGYMYWNNSPNTNRAAYTTANSASDVSYDQTTGQTSLPMDSTPDNLDVHMLRLGVQGKANLGFFDITAEAAAVPYAAVNGVIGADQTSTILDHSVYVPGNVASIKASPTDINGWGYGAMGEVNVDMHPTDHLTLGLGARLWYLQGTADATFTQATVGNPSSDGTTPPNFDIPPTFSKQSYIEVANPFHMMRYGLMANIGYTF